MSHRRAVMVVSWVGTAAVLTVGALAVSRWVGGVSAYMLCFAFGLLWSHVRRVVLWVVLVAEVRLGWLAPDEAARWVAGGEEG